MDYPKFIVSNQKEESISNKGLKKVRVCANTIITEISRTGPYSE